MSFFSRGFVFVMAVGVVVAFTSSACALPSPSAAEIHQKTEEVFQRSEFQRSEFQKTDISAFMRWLGRQIASFFQWLGGLYEGARALFWLILIGCIVLLVAMIALIVLQIRAVFAGGGKRRREAARHDARIRVSDDYRAAADARAAAGDFTEAIRCLFLALVYRFDEGGRVSFHKEYTNREYLDLLNDASKKSLRVLVDLLDDRWYGQRQSLREQYEECVAIFNRLSSGERGA